MTDTTTCESCSMPIESGRYCEHCTDESGNLQDFDTRFAAMVSWQHNAEPNTPAEQIEAETRAFMGRMPAWKDHPRLAD